MIKASIGIDIGGTNTEIGLVNSAGEVLATGRIPTNEFSETDAYVEALSAAIREVVARAGGVEVMGIGIGAPNGNYYNGTIEFAPNLNFKGIVPLVEKLKEQFDYPVVKLTNDANAAAIGEMIYGGAKGMDDFIMITLGTGLGSGIVANGEMIYGHDAFAGEIGHVVVEKNGRQCGCGRNGCLETYCSATGLVRTVYELMGTTLLPSALREQAKQGDITSKMVYDAAVKRDELAVEAFRFTAEMLGDALANAVAYTSPKAIFLFGGVANAGEMLTHQVKRYMEDSMLQIYKNKVEVLISALPGADAAILGASSLVWKELEKESVAV
ncbi:MAG: ROK family protein [Cytophagales bacterium]|nr:ROK family protein [Cytophagales bacterium]